MQCIITKRKKENDKLLSLTSEACKERKESQQKIKKNNLQRRWKEKLPVASLSLGVFDALRESLLRIKENVSSCFETLCPFCSLLSVATYTIYVMLTVSRNFSICAQGKDPI